MIRAAETSVLSHGETGNLYVQQPQTGFKACPGRYENRVEGLTLCGNALCRLIMLATFNLFYDWF